MRRTMLISIIMTVLVLVLLAFLLRHRLFASDIARQECAGDAQYGECVQMEMRGQKCFGREDAAECLRALDIPIDEAQITVNRGIPVPP